MNEIKKLYENAGVKPIDIAEYGSTYIPKKIEINGKPYPPFTTEKQLELIKWLTAIYELSIYWDKQYNSYRFVIRNYKNGRLNHSVCGYEVPFEETLAYLINRIWQDLTEEERKQIKEILK